MSILGLCRQQDSLYIHYCFLHTSTWPSPYGFCADPRIVLGLSIYTLLVGTYVIAYPYGKVSLDTRDTVSVLGLYWDSVYIVYTLLVGTYKYVCHGLYPYGKVSRDTVLILGLYWDSVYTLY